MSSLTLYLLRRLARHDNRAEGGEHAADAVADRDFGVKDLDESGATQLAHALLQRGHAVHPGMHVRKAAAIGIERDPRAASPASHPKNAGSDVMPSDEGAGLAA